MSNLETLIPWTPGQSGNPAGRPKNSPLITPALRRFAKMPAIEIAELLADEEAQSRLTVAEAIALVMLQKAMFDRAWGDKAREEVLRRLDGKEALVVEETTEVEERVIVRTVEAPLIFREKRG